MTPRERVLAAFRHEEPDCVPAWCGASDEFIAKAKRELSLPDEEHLLIRVGDDFRRIAACPAQAETPARSGATYRSVFGVDRRGFGYGMPMEHPLAQASLQQVHDHAWPDARCLDVSHLRDDAAKWGGQYAILGGDWSPFWHDAIDLLGMENLLLAMHDQPELVDALLRHIVDYYFEAGGRIFDAAGDVIDVFFIGNDFGSQLGPLVSPAMFRRFLLPHLRRLIQLGHAYRLKVMLHCCGNYAALIPHLIEGEIDALQSLQPCGRGMEPASLKSLYGSSVVFAGCIDSHHVLIEGTPELVRAETRRVLDVMMPGGGYVLSASHDKILEDTPVENVLAMFDVCRDYCC